MTCLLIVKLSSLGDVIQTLPVLHDISRHRPDVMIDWAVEEGYAQLLQLHKNLARVVPVGLRRWRRQGLLTKQSRLELKALHAVLASAQYDFAIDLQGLLKSALVARMSGAPIFGEAISVAREPLASLFYSHRFTPPKCPAPVRYRILAAKALGYFDAEGFNPYGGDPGMFGLESSQLKIRAVTLIHISARDEKLWPESHWIALGRRLASDGHKVQLPWGNKTEHQRAMVLGAAIPNAEVLPQMSLEALTWHLAKSYGAFGLDTGLAYLAIAAGIPTVRIYCGPDSGKTADFDWINSRSVGSFESMPTVADVWQSWEHLTRNSTRR